MDYSVVATSFNDEKIIIDYLNDICAQSFPPQELIIVDGGSTDNTVLLISEYSNDSVIPIKIISGKRLNIAEGYNVAIKSSQSDYIGVTGIGNRYEQDYFKKLASEFKEGVCGSYSPIRGINSTWFSRLYNQTILNGEEGMRMDIASNHGVLMKKSVFEDLGYYYEKLIYAGEDTEFFELAKKSHYSFIIVPNAIVLWDTPHTIKEFRKQIKNYTIADIQINPFRVKKMISRNILCIGYLLLSITLVLITILLSFYNPYYLSIVIIPIALLLYKKEALNPIVFLKITFQVVDVIRFRQYFDKKYTVERSS